MFLKMEISSEEDSLQRQSRRHAYKGGSRSQVQSLQELAPNPSSGLSSVKLIWMNYVRLDPLGRGYVGNRNGAAQLLS